MSELHAIDKYEFFNRKPSRKQIDSCLKNAIENDSKSITIIWGENQILMDYHPNHNQWYGSGWIKDIGGSDLADSLNSKQVNKTLNLWNS